MGMRISSSSGSTPTGSVAQWQQRQQAYKDLGAALTSGDMGAAKVAYAKMTDGASKFMTQHPDSPVALVGKALASGNMNAAQVAYDHMHVGHGRETLAPGARPPTPAPATASTGNNLNVVA